VASCRAKGHLAKTGKQDEHPAVEIEFVVPAHLRGHEVTERQCECVPFRQALFPSEDIVTVCCTVQYRLELVLPARYAIGGVISYQRARLFMTTAFQNWYLAPLSIRNLAIFL